MSARALTFVIACFAYMFADAVTCDVWGVYRDANLTDHWWGCASCSAPVLLRPILGVVFIRCDANECRWLIPVPDGAALETCELVARQRAARAASANEKP